MTEKLTHICDICEKPVTAGTGYIEVSYEDITRYREAMSIWKAQNPGPTFNGGAIFDLPEPAQWHTWHQSCDPKPDNELVYYMNVERVGTHVDLLHWTSHLTESKRWLDETDWSEFIQKHALPRNGAV